MQLLGEKTEDGATHTKPPYPMNGFADGLTINVSDISFLDRILEAEPTVVAGKFNPSRDLFYI